MRVYNNKNNLGRSITDKNFVMRVITLILAALYLLNHKAQRRHRKNRNRQKAA